jgi:geranylgeranyl reductase family protein
MSSHDIVIVGAGPAGCASALELANLDPSLAERVLLIDKAIFPRPKLCAGGVSIDTDDELRALGVDIDVPTVPVHTTQFVLPTGRLTFSRPNQFRIVRRSDFDHSLLKAARGRGVVAREGEPVIDVIRDRDEVIVRTDKAEYRAKILIAADGANSKVRARLGLSRSGRLMIAMELHAPFADARKANLKENMAILDLTVLDHGVPGYCWLFPTANQQRPVISMGIMAAPFGSGEAAQLKTIFGTWLSGFGLDLNDFEVASHPSLRYETKASCSQSRVLFVGDAAGVEPLFGEGIVSALAYGRIAARCAYDALRYQVFSFSDYEQRVRSSAIGCTMRRRRMIARRLYVRPKLAHFFLKQGALIRGLALLHVHKYGGQMDWEALTEAS